MRLSPPTGPDLTIYRQLAWGRLANFHLIDTRQYRSDQSCGDGLTAPCPGWDDPSRTLLGPTQEAWLFDRLQSSTSVWNVLANQVVFSPLLAGTLRNMDQWDGYPAQQQRAWDALQKVRNPVVITGDIHAAGATRLHQDLTDATTPLLGHELVGTGISSRFGDANLSDAAEQIFGGLPWVDYVNAHNQGYVVVDLSADQLSAAFRVASTVDSPGGTVSTDYSVDIPARAAPGEPVPPDTPPAPNPPTGSASPATPVRGTPDFTG